MQTDSPAQYAAHAHLQLILRLEQVIKATFGTATQMRRRFEPGTVGRRTANAIGQQIRRARREASIGEKQSADISVGTLAQFADMTGHSLAWLVSGEGPERHGELAPRASLQAELAAAVEAHVSDINQLVRNAASPAQSGAQERPLLVANGAKLLECILALARVDAQRQRASAIQASNWRVAMDVDRRVAGASTERPHLDRAIRVMDRMASDDAERSLRDGTGPLGLFDLHELAIAGDVACWNDRPLPPFQVRVESVEPFSDADPRPRATLVRQVSSARRERQRDA